MEFLFGVPKDVHLAHLKRERATGGKWSDAAVRVSLLLDVDAGKINDHISYGRIWRWNVAERGPTKGQRNDEAGRSRVRRSWDGIVVDVLDWITFGGTSFRSPLVHKVPEDWWALVDYDPNDHATTSERPPNDRENGESSTERQPNDRRTTSERPPNDRLTRTDPDLNTQKNPSPPTPPVGGTDGGKAEGEKVKRKKKPKPPPVEIPDWIDPDLWGEWETLQREKKKALTPTRVKHQIRTLDKLQADGHDPNECIRLALAGGWQGFYAPKPGRGGSPVDGAGRQAAGPNGHGAGGRQGGAVTVRGAAGDSGPRLTAAERRGQFGPDRAAELVAAALALPGSGTVDDRARDGD